MSANPTNYAHLERIRATIDKFLASTSPMHWTDLAIALLPAAPADLSAKERTQYQAWITFTAMAARGTLDKKLGRHHPAFETACDSISARAAEAIAGLTSPPSSTVDPIEPEQGRVVPVANAPRRRQATGGRRAHTLETIALSKTDFRGLPEGVKHPKELLAQFKKAAPYLGASPNIVALMDLLFSHTRPQDWEGDTRPIVWPSNRLIEEQLQIGDRAVKQLIRRAHELLCITMRDNPSGKRHGYRDSKTGKLVLASCYGFDLSPLAARHAELVRIAAEGRSKFEARQNAARQARIARHRILQCLATAEEQGLWSDVWLDLESRTAPLFPIIDASRSLAELEQVATTLRKAALEAESQLAAAMPATSGQGSDPAPHERGQESPTGDSNGTLNNSTNISLDFKKSVQAEPAPSTAPPPPINPHPRDDGLADVGKQKVAITASELAVLVPRLGALVSGKACWQAFEQAVAADCHRLGIAQRVWQRAIEILGRDVAVIAYAITLAKPDGHFTASGGAYFAGMIARAERGEFNLARSIFGLRRRLQEATGQRPPRSNAPAGRAGGTPPLVSGVHDVADAERKRQAWLASLSPEELQALRQKRAAYIAGRMQPNSGRS